MSERLQSLRATLADPASAERGFAAAELGLLRDVDSVDALAKLLLEHDRGLGEVVEDALVQIGGSAVARAMVPLLRLEELHPRNIAMQVLTRIGAEAVPALAPLVKDEDPDLRLFSLEILFSIGGEQVRAPLQAALADANPNVATAAARALGELRLHPAIEALVEVSGGDGWLACAALTSLGQLGGQRAQQVLMAVPTSAPAMVQFTAVNALAESADATAIPHLQAIAANSGPPLRDAAIQAVIAILDRAYETVLEDAAEYVSVETLINFLRKGSAATTASTIRLLGRLDRDGVDEALLEVLAQDDPRVIPHLREIFVHRKVEKLRPFVRLLDDAALSYQLRKLCVDVLALSGREDALVSLIAHLKYGDRGMKVDLVRAISSFDSPEAEQAVVDEAKNPDEFVRCAVADVLSPASSHHAFEAMVQLLGDRSAAVRQRAIRRCRKADPDRLRGKFSENLEGSNEPLLESLMLVLEANLQTDMLARVAERCRTAGPLFFATALRVLSANLELLEPQLLAQVGEVLVARKGDPKEEIRVVVCKGLAVFPSPGSAELLLGLACDDPSILVQYQAVRALGGRPEHHDALLSVLPVVHAYVASSIIEVLSEAGHPRVEEHAAALIEQGDPYVAEVLREALGVRNA